MVRQLKTRLMLNIGDPEMALYHATLPHQGVGLTRMEFIINSFIGVHPSALVNFDTLDDNLKATIGAKISTTGTRVGSGAGAIYPEEYFISRLASGLAKIAACFAPYDVIVRFSDFKTNEYRNLLGGENYEPVEENPMLGWRGCSRYYSDKYRREFGLECQAIKRLRESMGLTNIIVMLPFCRTPEECRRVLEVMREWGLSREDGLKVYLMCEIPSNVIEADEFSKYIDGVSIGGNDLFQLVLGIDRDSSIDIDDHTNVSYRRMIREAIKKYHEHNIKVGFCGQQPSESLEFCQFLIGCGIDSISVIPDTLLKTGGQLSP